MKNCTCSSCDQQNPQPLINFYKDSKSRDGLSNRCKSCIKVVKSRYYANNSEKEKQKCREWKKKNPNKVHAANIRNSYSLSADSYIMMLFSQNHACAICKQHKSLNTKDKNGKPRNLAVDHCHKTNKVRGLLCYSCNLALGMLKDDVLNARALIEYLEKYEQKN